MEINLNGPVTDKTSYGLVLLNLFLNLEIPAESIFVHPVGQVSQVHKSFESIYSRLNQLFPYDAPSLRVYHQFDMASSIGRGPRCGMVFSEMDRLTKFECHHLNSLDLVIVPSEWAKSVYSDSGVTTQIRVAELGYDPTIFKPVQAHKDTCVFLSVGKWEVRKQQDQIVEAFNKAFCQYDNVQLWMAYDNMFMDPRELGSKESYYRGTPLGSKIIRVPRQNTQAGIARLMNSAFCFVAPSLAEGANLELIEAMACGMHTIATNYSGHTAFLSKNANLLIEPIGKTTALDGRWFKAGGIANDGNWCTYKLDDLVDHMKWIYGIFNGDRSLNNKAIEHAKQFTWKNTADKTLSFLKEL